MKWEEAIQEIKRRVDIGEVVSRYVSLKRRGDHGVGLCPFHSEKTPSFHVRSDKGYFKCFGCQASGDVFAFLEQKTGQLFSDVVRQLAQETGIQLESSAGLGSKPISQTTAHLAHAVEVAHRYFQKALLEDPAASVARTYWVEKRRLLPSWLSKYQVGFGGSDDSRLVHFIQKASVSRDHALAVGILKQGESGLYGLFHSRLTFPIRDHHGVLVGFGARLLNEDSNKPKYINSPSSSIYQKSQLFYGLWECLPWLRQKKQAILVEGYTDVMALQELGYAAIAPLGTKVTKDHVSLLSRYTKQVVLGFDADSAGAEAKNRAMFDFLNAGFDVRMVQFSLKDPAAFYEQNRIEQLKKEMGNNRDALEHWILHLAANCFGASDRVRAIHQLIPFLAVCSDEIAMNQYIRFAAQSFLEEERLIQMEVKRFLKKPQMAKQRAQRASHPPVSVDLTGTERLLVCAVLKDPKLSLELIPYLESFSAPNFKEWLVKCSQGEQSADINDVFQLVIDRLLEQSHLLSTQDARQIIKDWMKQTDLAKKRESLKMNYQNLLNAQRTGDVEATRKALLAYSSEAQNLQIHKQSLSKTDSANDMRNADVGE